MRRLLKGVAVRENGKSGRISTLEAVLVKALSDALQGRPKAFVEIVKAFAAIGIFRLEAVEKPVWYCVNATVHFVRTEARYGDPKFPAGLAKGEPQNRSLDDG